MHTKLLAVKAVRDLAFHGCWGALPGPWARYTQLVVKLIFTLCSIAHFDPPRKSGDSLTAEEHEEARRRAYGFALERGGGKLPGYDPDAASGDFWRAAGEVIAQRQVK